MNGLILSIISTVLILTGSIFTMNYYLIDLLSVISIISFLLGLVVSLYSSHINCKKVSKKVAFKMAFKNVLYSLIGFFIVYFVSFIRDPFLEIFGNGKLGFSCGQSFLVSLNTITSTIINYYSSIKTSCKVPQTEIDNNLKSLDKYLNKKPKKKKKTKIEIRD